MKKLLVLMTFTLLAGLAWGESYEDQLRDRLAPAGNVCIEGQPCETATVAAAASASAEPMTGDEVYTKVCAACHGSGVLGAPRLGNADDWAARISKGVDTLHNHAINGFNNMPPKGGNGSLSDEEVEAAVDHMLAAVQ
ncbi:c-type cytochrome [Saccharospirillum mangrovi]|uniref:c-type cytochrome n=1 Tax=Saccharospirillum mangrovi TaxID=2161747 RepID=UPI000D3499E6|nr:c-type cytochrome [Saccharospirillum mangrovi]